MPPCVACTLTFFSLFFPILFFFSRCSFPLCKPTNQKHPGPSCEHWGGRCVEKQASFSQGHGARCRINKGCVIRLPAAHLRAQISQNNPSKGCKHGEGIAPTTPKITVSRKYAPVGQGDAAECKINKGRDLWLSVRVWPKTARSEAAPPLGTFSRVLRSWRC